MDEDHRLDERHVQACRLEQVALQRGEFAALPQRTYGEDVSVVLRHLNVADRAAMTLFLLALFATPRPRELPLRAFELWKSFQRQVRQEPSDVLLQHLQH